MTTDSVTSVARSTLCTCRRGGTRIGAGGCSGHQGHAHPFRRARGLKVVIQLVAWSVSQLVDLGWLISWAERQGDARLLYREQGLKVSSSFCWLIDRPVDQSALRAN